VNRPLTGLTFGEGLQIDVAFSPDGRSIAYASDRAGNFDIWIQSISGGDARQLTNSPAQETQPAWSPDGRRIAFRSERDGGGLFIVALDGGAERQVSAFGTHPVWSADGSEVLFRSGNLDTHSQVYVVSPEGGEPPTELLRDFLREGFWSWIAPHPDGRVSVLGRHRTRGVGFFTVSRDGQQVATSAVSEDLPLQPDVLGTQVRRFQWNDTGTALYAEGSVNQVQNIWRIDVDAQTLRWQSAERLTGGSGPDVGAALSRDGRRLAFTTLQRTARLWSFPYDAASGEPTGSGVPVTPEDGNVVRFALTNDGRRAAYSFVRTGKRGLELWVADLDAGTRELFATDALAGAWSPDGRTLAYVLTRPGEGSSGERAVALREIGGPERIVWRWSRTASLRPTDWTPDGRALLGNYSSPVLAPTALVLLPVAPVSEGAAERVLVADPGHWLWQARFSPNGRWLSFVAQPVDAPSQVAAVVVPAAGAPRPDWVGIAPDHGWSDKPTWAPDGRALYFLSSQNSSFINLWRVRFDPESGRPSGAPSMLTHIDSPGRLITRDGGGGDVGVSRSRVVLTMATATGNIWMLENADR
jgi:eukaryotic-like serine/threonine-protein kinase